jgi:hypothetical protein
MYEANDGTSIFQMDNKLDAIVHYNSLHLDYVYYRYTGSEIYDVTNLYYFGSYTDNHSGEEWKLIDKNNNLLKIHNNDNQHLFLTQTNASLQNYYNESFNPYEYYFFFFSGIDYETSGDNSFSVSFPLSYLYENPEYAEYFRGLIVQKNSSYENAYVHLTYDFLDNNEGLHFEFWIDVIIQDEYADGITVSFESDLSFPTSVAPFTYAWKDYYVDSFNTISDDMPKYTAGESALQYMYESANNYVKYQLEPGYYSMYCVGNSAPIEGSKLLNEDGEEVDANPYYKITEAGTYYFSGVVRETGNTTVVSYQVPVEDIGTIDNPIIADESISGHVQKGQVNYHLLEISSSGGLLKLTGTNISSSRGVHVSCNHSGYCVYPDGVAYFLIEAGQDVIVRTNSTYVSDYDIDFEFLPFEVLQIEYSLMKEIIVLLDPYQSHIAIEPIVLGPSHSVQRVRFTILEKGDYLINLNRMQTTGLDEHNHYLPGVPLYSESGELVYPDCLSIATYLEPGNYYIEISWYENEYALISVYVMRSPS